MQAKDIKLGAHYAAEFENSVVDLYVTKVHTVRDTDGIKSYVSGWAGATEDRREVKTLPVAKVLSDLALHQNLMAEREKNERERKAKQEAREAKQWALARRLAKAIDALPIKSKYGHRSDNPSNWDGNWDMALVFCDGSSIEVNEHAFDKLNTFLRKVGIQLGKEEEVA